MSLFKSRLLFFGMLTDESVPGILGLVPAYLPQHVQCMHDLLLPSLWSVQILNNYIPQSSVVTQLAMCWHL